MKVRPRGPPRGHFDLLRDSLIDLGADNSHFDLRAGDSLVALLRDSLVALLRDRRIQSPELDKAPGFLKY